ncbi:MAG: DUF2442 domain-containing protein [Candidatus Eremiobacteraeota bacterium]|nr:DUF2442 domain-containing protein [Candidatus Eremiobacteraeota bacterium]
MPKTAGPILQWVSYMPRRDAVSLQLSSGAVVEIPRVAIRELRRLSQSELKALRSDNAGMTISQRDLDIDIYLPGLLGDMLGVRPAAVLGRKGGSSRSSAKRRASRQNGRRGGRPKKALERVG